MNKIKIGYLVSTGLLTALLCFSVGNYIFNHEFVSEVFTKFGYPAYIIYPLAAAKLLGLIAIWSRKSNFLLNLAYAGFFFNFILAFFAHVMVGDMEFPGAIMAMIFLITSYVTQKAIYELDILGASGILQIKQRFLFLQGKRKKNYLLLKKILKRVKLNHPLIRYFPLSKPPRLIEE